MHSPAPPRRRDGGGPLAAGCPGGQDSVPGIVFPASRNWPGPEGRPSRLPILWGAGPLQEKSGHGQKTVPAAALPAPWSGDVAFPGAGPPAAGGPGKSSRGKGGSVLPAVSASGLLRALRRARLIADFKKVDDVALRRARRGAPVTGGAGPRSHAKRAPENRGPCRYWSVRPSGLRCTR